jgi:flagellar hook assembly protein FlgD
MSKHGWERIAFLAASSLAILTADLRGTNVSGTISTNTTWTTAGSPYVVTGSVAVEGASAPVLTIQAGVTVQFNAGQVLYIGNGAAGGLSAVGTSASPITFTANGSTTPGFWGGIQIMSHATTGTAITWASVSYGGTGSSGGVRIQAPAVTVTLTNVTVQNSTFAGVNVESGTPTLSTCTISSNPWGVYVSGGTPTLNSTTRVQNNTAGGVYLAYPGSASLQTVTISTNTGYAISQDGRVTLGNVSSITATGNTTNAVEVRAGPNIDINTTWKNTGLPYVVTGTFSVEKNGAPTPVLTVPAGVTIKFTYNVGLLVGNGYPGELSAVGTSAQPIVFTAASGTTAGSWAGLSLMSHVTSASQLKYATVSYGNNGIYIQQSNPTIQNTTLLTNTTGVNAYQFTGSIVNCNFSGNSSGLVNQTSTYLVSAGLNYWGAASGPSGSGPGTGQSVGAGVTYEPWLMAAPTNPNYLNAFSQKNRTFNPQIGINTTISSGSAQSAAWTVTVLSGTTPVRTYTGSGMTWNVVWDGKNGSGVDQANGTYFYQLQTGTSAIAEGLTVIDRTRQLTLSGLSIAPAYFSPNADGVQDTALTNGAFNFDDVAWTITVKAGATPVRNVSGNGSAVAFAWDGKNDSGALQLDGLYTVAVTGVDGSANVSGSGSTTLDMQPPIATITAPPTSPILSNVYQAGVTDLAVVGTASDTNIDHWQLDNQGVGTIATGTTSVTAATLATWATLPLTNASYTLKLQVWDKAGNTSTTTKSYTVANFKVAANTSEFNGSTGGTVSYTSTVPFTLTETLFMKNAAGSTVKTLVNALSRPAGSYNDSWNGKNTSNVLQPDGVYYYVATVTDGTHNTTWDLTNTYWGGGLNGGHSQSSPLDPFKNQSLLLSYNFPAPGRTTISFAAGDYDVSSACPPPDFCVVSDRYEESGPHTYTWAGVDSTGKYRADARRVEVITKLDTFSKNAVILFGTKPTVSAVSLTPFIYAPRNGTQTINYTLGTYNSQSATVTVTFFNQLSMSVIRTITQTGVAPGARTAVWDGKADNGMWAAPGQYLISV